MLKAENISLSIPTHFLGKRYILRYVSRSFLEVTVIKETIKEAETRMKGAIQSLEEDLTGIRTGRASPALVERLPIEYYGTTVPLVQLASISVPEPRALMIRPFDATSLKAIERGILTSDLGLTPNNDGKVIRLNLPVLTEERRRDLVKVVHSRLEDTRVSIRNIRRDLMKDLREFEKEKLISEDDLKKAEEELQKLTDKYIEQVDDVGYRKEREIMEV
jgi:ribosome recycling factor